jgi:hypothetical protein
MPSATGIAEATLASDGMLTAQSSAAARIREVFVISCISVLGVVA